MKPVRRLLHDDPGFDRELQKLTAFPELDYEELTATAASIVKDVRTRGDAALLEYTNRFDNRNASANDILISPQQMKEAVAHIPERMRSALEDATARVTEYHQYQVQNSWEYSDADGSVLGQKITALDRVGIYVPGGKAVYPSSVLMNALPARVAGVGEIVMAVPAVNDELNPLVLAAAHIAGVDYGFSIGGAQAIAALACGTATVPRVDKITGPGNRYVAAAKRLVYGQVGIDMIAGPSEVLIITDGSADPDWIAMDMFAQAEHDEDARAILVCTGRDFFDRVDASMERLLPAMQRANIIETALQRNAVFIAVADLEMAADVSNLVAPEHLELALADVDTVSARIRHAGAMFLGHYAAEVLGDYCAGPNHVLPTGGTARFSSPLGVYDFQKRTSIVRCTAESAGKLAETAAIIARGEGLHAHAGSAELRLVDPPE